MSAPTALRCPSVAKPCVKLCPVNLTAAPPPLRLLMVLWHMGLFSVLLFGQIGVQGRKEGCVLRRALCLLRNSCALLRLFCHLLVLLHPTPPSPVRLQLLGQLSASL